MESKKDKRSFWNDLKNIKRNYKIVKTHPLAGLRFKYKIQRNTLIIFGVFLIYQFYSIIKNYSGMSLMSWVGRGLTLLILFVILNKAYQGMTLMKKNLQREEDYYQNNPKAYEETFKELNNTDVKKDIQDILDKFEGKNGR